MCGVANALHSFVLEAVEPAFGRRVVPAVAFPTHRADPTVFPELVLKGMAGVRAPPVGVMHQAWSRALSEPGQDPCIGHDVCRHARFEGSAHDLSGEPIENDGQGEPAFIDPQGRDIRRPDLVRCRRGEVPVEPIGRYRQTVFGVRRDLGAPLVAGVDTVVAHPSFYPFLARRITPGTPFATPAGTAVGPLEFGVNGSDERPLESSVLCSQARQFHFFRGHPSAARAVQLALGRGFPPVASGLGAPSERLDHNTHALPVLDPFDRQFLELRAVDLLRQFHLWPPKLTSILRHLWLTNFRRNLNQSSM